MKPISSKVVTLAAAVMLAPAGAVVAQATEDAPTRLETIEVEAPPLGPQAVRMEADALPAGRELADVLRDIAGVSGSRMGGHGTDPTIRGLGQDRINVLLDGAFVFGACPNRMDPPTAYGPAAGFDEVTVIRGVPTLERPGGPGGTILLERHTPAFHEGEAPRIGMDVSTRGNGGATGAAFDVAVGTEAGFLRAFGSWAEADDYEDGNGDRVRSAYEERGGGVVAGWTASPGQRITASFETRQLRDVLFAGAGMDSPTSDTDTWRLRYDADELGVFRAVRAEVYGADVTHVMDNYTLRQQPSPIMRLRAPSTSDTLGGRIAAELEAGAGVVRFGLEDRENERSAERINDTSGMLQSVLWPDVSIAQAGAFAEYIRPLGTVTTVVAGLRYDRVRARAGDVDRQPAGMALTPSALYQAYYGLDGTGAKTEDNVGGLLRVEQSLALGTLHAGLSRTWRTADATERYIASNGGMPSMRWVGNPGLDPERHDQFEAGWRAERDGWHAEASLFHNEVQDFVLRDRFHQPGNNATIYRNVDAQLTGGELSLGRRFGERWHTRLDVGYVRATNEDDDRPIAQTPPLEATAALDYRTDRWSVGLRARAADRQGRVDDDPLTGSGLDAGQTPGWAVFDLYGECRLSRAWRLRVGIDNLLDRDYAQHLNRSSAFDAMQVQVDEPGRAAWLSVSFAPGR